MEVKKMIEGLTCCKKCGHPECWYPCDEAEKEVNKIRNKRRKQE